jgi:type I restriction enzyme, S subunit
MGKLIKSFFLKFKEKLLVNKKIKEFAKIRRGASPRPIADPKYFGGNVGWVRIADVSISRKYLRKTTQYVSELGESLSVRVDKGDLIMSIAGTVGRPIIIDMPACIHDGFVHIYDLQEANNEYLYYSLQFIEDKIKSFGQAGTQVNLNTGIVGNIGFYFPEYSEQTKIAEILSTIDAAIDTTAQLIAKYERIKTGLMQDLLTRGIDEKGNIRTEGEHEFKDSPLGRFPKEWEYLSVSSQTISSAFGPRFSGECYDNQGNVLALRTTDLDIQGNINWQNVPLATLDIDYFQNHFLQKGDFVISRSGTIGITSVFENAHLPVLAGAFMIRYRFKESLSSYFAKLYFTWEEGKKRILDVAEGGVLKNLKGSSFAKLFIPVPPIDEQNKIVSIIENYSDLINTEKKYLNKLKSQKTGLMQTLLTGKVRVEGLL